MTYFHYNLATKKRESKKEYKLIKNAMKFCPKDCVVTNEEGLKWIEKHPEWVEERLEMAKKMRKSYE